MTTKKSPAGFGIARTTRTRHGKSGASSSGRYSATDPVGPPERGGFSASIPASTRTSPEGCGPIRDSRASRACACVRDLPPTCPRLDDVIGI